MPERKPQLPPRRAPDWLPCDPDPDPDAPSLLAPQPLPEDADHPGRRREPAAMRTLVEATLRRLKLPDLQMWREELAQVWPRIVPAEMAAHVRPGKWEQGVLYLYAANNTRLFEFRRAHLRAVETRLRAQFGAARLKQVRVMIDPEPGNRDAGAGR
jgi:hypothetical protein